MKHSTRYQVRKQSIEDEAFWKKHIEAHAVSKLSKSAYCKASQVDYPRFMYWSQKIVPTTAVSELIAVKVQSENQSPDQTILCTLVRREGDCLHIYNERVLSIVLKEWR